MAFSLTCGAWASVPLCDALPLDEALPQRLGFGKLMEQQAKGRSTTKSVYAWYRESCAHLSVPVVQLLDGMLAIDPRQRMTMRDVLSHLWLREEIEVAMPAATRAHLTNLAKET